MKKEKALVEVVSPQQAAAAPSPAKSHDSSTHLMFRRSPSRLFERREEGRRDPTRSPPKSPLRFLSPQVGDQSCRTWAQLQGQPGRGLAKGSTVGTGAAPALLPVPGFGATCRSHSMSYLQGPETIFVIWEGCFPNRTLETKLGGLLKSSGLASRQRALDGGEERRAGQTWRQGADSEAPGVLIVQGCKV